MLTIKLKADEVRLIKSAAYDDLDWAHQVSQMLNEKIATAEVAKTFGLATKAPKGMTYKRAHDILKSVLGSALLVPAAPDGKFFAQVNRAISIHGMDEEYVQRLAEYCKANMRPRLQIEFVLTQAPRILEGEWAVNRKTDVMMSGSGSPVWRRDTLPED